MFNKKNRLKKITGSEKIYCSTCKYRGEYLDYCHHKNNEVIRSNAIKRWTGYDRMCEGINQNNNCGLYEPTLQEKIAHIFRP